MLTQVQQNQWLFKADIWRIFSTCFSYPENEAIANIQQFAKELQPHSTIIPETKPLFRFLQRASLHSTLETEYSQLFIQGNIPLSETAYHPSIDIYSELSAFYQAFGGQPMSGDAPDTLAYELEFLGVLCVKVALSQNTEQREIAFSAYLEFVRNHLLPMVEKLHKRLSENFPEAIYTQLTEYLLNLLRNENRALSLN